MGQQVGLCADVVNLDNVTIADDAATTSFRNGLGGDDFPKVVGVVVGVSGNLLALATDTAIGVCQGVALVMGMEENLGFLVLDGDNIEIVNLCERSAI